MNAEREFDDHAEGTTPTTEEVRSRWMHLWRGYTHAAGIQAFDRWLLTIQAEAWDNAMKQFVEMQDGHDWSEPDPKANPYRKEQ